MLQGVEFFFDFVSPYTYLAQMLFAALNQFPGKMWVVSHKPVAVAAGLGMMGIHRRDQGPENERGGEVCRPARSARYR
jgi:2-hydroxychromene-2-carboxylate isomerase